MLRFVSALLLLLALMVPAAGTAAAQQTPIRYVPTPVEIARLLGNDRVIANEAENDGWDESSGYVVAIGADRTYDLFASARILRGEIEARRYFEDVSQVVSAENERTESRRMPDVARQLNAEEILDVKLIFVDPEYRTRQSDYVRLLRFGRVVVMLEALGDPAFDDRGMLDTERARAIDRLSELMAGRIVFYPPDAARPMSALAPFAQEWTRHGANLTLGQTGRAELFWRAYRWCHLDPTPPCDRMQGNVIDPGGGAAIAVLRVEGTTAHGVVIGSSDTDAIGLGAITISLSDHGTLEMRQGRAYLRLCGPDFYAQAPAEVQAEQPCGV